MKNWLSMLLILGLAISAVMVVAQDNGKYGGTDNCKMCHPDTFDEWSKTSHAKSYDLLVAAGQEKNAECLPCHTTGYGKGGFVDEATTPGLKGTTCEACHGPGAEHMGDKTKIKREPSAKVCAACHQTNNIHSVPKK